MTRNSPSIASQRLDHEAGNRAAAQAILENPARYEGALTDWAQTFMERHPASGKSADLPVKKPHPAQAELFPEAA